MAVVHPELYLRVGEAVTALHFIEDVEDGSKLLAVGTFTGEIQLWDLRSQTKEKSVKLYDDQMPILWIGQSKNQIIVQARFSTKINLLSKSLEKDAVHTIEEPVNHFCRGRLLDDKIAVPSGDRDFALIDTKMAKTVRGKKDEGTLTCLTFLNPPKIATGYESGLVQIVGIDGVPGTRISLSSILPEIAPSSTQSTSILALDFDSDKNILVIGGALDFIATLQFEHETIRLLKKRTLPTKGISDVIIRKGDGKILACSSWDGTVRLFSWLKPANLKPLGALKFHEESVDALAVNAISPYMLASASKEGLIALWSVYN